MVCLIACQEDGEPSTSDGGEDDTDTGGVELDEELYGDKDCAARSLLNYLYDISGTHTLSGQESMFTGGAFPSIRDRYVYTQVDKYPAVYSSDFGDVVLSNLDDRQTVVDNAISYAAEGSIIQLHYHMTPPDLNDGAGFEAMSSFDGDYPYIDEILTPDHEYHEEHMRRLDELAGYLAQLRDAGVAVLWRPYHEMNGGWFWWGGQERFTELWIQQWEYFTNEKNLTNLVWVWSLNHWNGDVPTSYYPGHEYVDVVGVDVYLTYGHHFDQHLHDGLMQVGDGRPIAITENGDMPPIPDIQETQPNWVYWATWWGFESPRNAMNDNTEAVYEEIYGDPRVLTQDELRLPECP